VDLYLCGHQHNYERMFDIAPGGKTTRSTTNPPATTYIVTGAGGNRENCTVFKGDPDPRVAFRAPEWGYSILELHNNTHLYW
jgi:acid phosphatase type 7